MIFKQAAEIIGESNCLTEGLESYAVDGIIPELVVFPESVEQVSALMKLAEQERWAVIPRGSGTKMSLGNIPKGVDMVLVLRKLNKILEYEPDDLTATVEAGIIVEDFQKHLKEKNQFFPLDPPFSSEATLGGIVATNSNGPSRFFHGSVRDLVIGTQVVHPGGTITRSGGKVVKNVTGYDMNKLYTGSLGTLGILTELSLKLRPLPEVSKTLLISFPSISEAAQLVLQISTSELLPTALEILDSQAWKYLIGDMGIQDPGTSFRLAIKLEGLSENVERQIFQIRQWGQEKGSSGIEVLQEDPHHKFWYHVQNHPQILSGKASQVVCGKASFLASKVKEFFQITKELGDHHGLESIMLAHAGSGIVYIYFLNKDATMETNFVSTLSRVLLEIRSLAGRLEGSMILEIAPVNLKRSIDVWGPTGDRLTVMKLLKEQFDSRSILNPGRFVGGI